MFLLLAALLSAPAEPATIAAGSIKRFGVVSVVAACGKLCADLYGVPPVCKERTNAIG